MNIFNMHIAATGHSLFANYEPASASGISFNVRPSTAFHSMRPLALQPSTTAAAVLGELKV